MIIKKLLFVYDADLDLPSLLAEVAHRTIRPDTYVCNLCKVTYGLTGKKTEWLSYLRALEQRGFVTSFQLRRSFRRDHPKMANVSLPALLVVDEQEGSTLLLDGGAFNKVRTVEDLKHLVDSVVTRLK